MQLGSGVRIFTVNCWRSVYTRLIFNLPQRYQNETNRSVFTYDNFHTLI